MEAFWGLVWLVVALAAAALPIALLVWLLSLTGRVRYLESRVEELRQQIALQRAVAAQAPVQAPAQTPPQAPAQAPAPPALLRPDLKTPRLSPTPETPAETPAPEPEPVRLPASEPVRVAAASVTPTPSAPHIAPPPPPRFVPPPAAPATVEPEAARASAWSIEELIGGVWLQNIGSVLLLVAFFFLILWGYTTGRIGPGGLVAAGVLLGGLFAWRGDRVARSLPAFGHALVGIGLGIVYLSLYLGHFTLFVLPTLVAFGLLTATSLLAILAGQYYRVQTIAALGVIGAFVPQIAATLADLPGFEHQPAGLLGYLAFVNFAVFWLAARSSWSGLALSSVLLTAATWAVSLQGRAWDAPVEAGLCALFVLLGLAPLRRWAERAEGATITDLALVTLAPYALVVASWPYFTLASRETTASFLFALTAAYAAAAWWIDRRRERQDLWHALITACVIFGTSALERALGTTWTPMGWCVEAAALIALGVRPRALWLRVLGYVVFVLGAFSAIPQFLQGSAATATNRLGDVLPLSALTADSIRGLIAIAAFAVAARALERRSDALTEPERAYAAGAAHAVGQVFVAVWLARHAWNVALALSPAVAHVSATALALTALFWIGQAGTLLALGLRHARPFRRAEGYVVLTGSAAALAMALNAADVAGTRLPYANLPALLVVAWIVAAFLIALMLGKARERLAADERFAPEFVTGGAHAALAAWLGGQTSLYARNLGGEIAVAYGFALTSLLWAAQGAWLVVRGLLVSRVFLRATGYVLGIVSCLTIGAALLASAGLGAGTPAYLHAAAQLELTWIALLLAVAQVLARSRHRLDETERHAPEAASAAAHAALAGWAGVETGHLARVMGGPNAFRFATSLIALAWALHAAWLILRGLARSSMFQRGTGYVIGTGAALAFVLAANALGAPPSTEAPFVGPSALMRLAWMAVVFAIAHVLARADDKLDAAERHFSLILTAGAHGTLLHWSTIETGAYARSLGPERGAIVGPALASGAWLAQAAGAFAIGWIRRSSFLRRLGLVLFGLTVLKVTLFDLSRADTFVRAMIAVAVGTVLLVVSYVYQRARKNRSTQAATPPTLSEP